MQAVIALHGDLGSGKTTFARHLLQALGVAGSIKSPTYTIVEPYAVGAFSVWHFDFYRFNDPQEWEDAGFRDIFASPGLKLVEWPEKAAAMLPVADLDLRLTIALGTQDSQSRSEAARLVTIGANTLLGAALAGACT